MDASHILVGGLTGISFALLVWIEIRSRRNISAQPQHESGPVAIAEPPPPNRKQRNEEGRRS